MIDKLKIYFKLKPSIEEAGKLWGMPFGLNVAISMLMLVLAAVVNLEPFFGKDEKWIVGIAYSVLQAVLYYVAGHNNPDGTHSAYPYIPPAPKLPDDFPKE